MLQELVVVGGLEMQNQAKALARRPHVVVATPGRLKVHCFPAMHDTAHHPLPHGACLLLRLQQCKLTASQATCMLVKAHCK